MLAEQYPNPLESVSLRILATLGQHTVILEHHTTQLETIIAIQADTSNKFALLRTMWSGTDANLAASTNDVATAKNNAAEIKADLAVIITDVATLKTDVAVITTDVAGLKIGQATTNT